MNKATQVAVLISGSGSNLQAFIDSIAAGKLPVEINLVISNNKGAYGLERAKNAGIKHQCISHHDYTSRLTFDQALMKCIDRVNPDLVILAGFMRILTEGFVNHYRNRLINIHPSLLPKYPGTQTHERAITAGDHWHGASIHFVVPEVDAGPLILQGRLAIKEHDTPETLQQRIHKIEHQLYPLAVQWFAEGRLNVKNAQVLLDGKNSTEQLQTFDL